MRAADGLDLPEAWVEHSGALQAEEQVWRDGSSRWPCRTLARCAQTSGATCVENYAETGKGLIVAGIMQSLHRVRAGGGARGLLRLF